MKKNTYYIYYPRDFANEYVLMYVQNDADREAIPEGAVQISYAEAKKFCTDENQRRRNNPAFSGYASNTIVPAAYDWVKDGRLENGRHFRLNNYVWYRVEESKPQKMCMGESVRFSGRKKEA